MVGEPYSIDTHWHHPEELEGMKNNASHRGKTVRLSILAALAVSMLASCGGGSGNGDSTGQEGSQVPPPPAVAAITLLAGSANPYGYQDGPVEQARLGISSGSDPYLLAMTASGDLLIGDMYNEALRRFSPTSQLVSTVGRDMSVQGAAVAPDGSIYVADSNKSVVRRIAPDGSVSLVAGQSGVRGFDDGPADRATFWTPRDLTFDSAGHVYVLQGGRDSDSTLVRRIDVAAGQVSTVATLQGSIQKLVVEPDGSLLVPQNRTLERHLPDGTVLVIGPSDGSAEESRDGPAAEARFQYIHDLVVNAQGHVFVLEGSYHKPSANVPDYVRVHDHFSIRQVDAQGNVSTIGRWNTTLETARVGSLVIDPAGTFYVSQGAGSGWVSRLGPHGTSSVVLGTPSAQSPYVELDKDGVGNEARLPRLSSLAIAPSGQLLVASSSYSPYAMMPPYLRAVTPQGETRRVAYTSASPIAHQAAWRALVADKAGNIYTNTLGTSPSHNPALIYRVSPEGVLESWLDLSKWINPFAYEGQTHFFLAPISGMAMDDAGMLYVAGVNGVVLKVSPDKEVTVLAGQPGAIGHMDGIAEQARFSILGNLAIDCEGNLLALDGLRDDLTGIGPSIRKITPQGVVSTIAGDAGQPQGLADGLARQARFAFSSYARWWAASTTGLFGWPPVIVGEDVALKAHLASDSACNVYVTDPVHHVIRRLTTAGQVETVLGTPGQSGFLSSPLPGVIHTPTGIAVQDKRLFFTMKDAVAFVDLP